MRPIDADSITYCSYDLDNYHYFCAVDKEVIAEMPTLTIDDLRFHGRWIICSDGYYPYCSECKHEPKSGDMTPYCPMCGTKMDLDGK